MSATAFHGAHDFVIHDLHQQDNSTNITNNYTTITHTASGTRPGIAKLLAASMPDAFHDSSARYPPPRCHPKSRRDFIAKLTGWGTSSDNRYLLWMYGPAGAGKSAVAQTSTEELAEQGMLGGSVFFSRPNKRNNPNALFTSLAYQLTTKIDAYANALEQLIEKDPTLLTKSIRKQFQELLIRPLQELQSNGQKVKELVLVVDGLDECEGVDEQCDIVEIVVESVRRRSTPFRWIFVSRPETRIVASFNMDDVPSLSLHIELTVSREIDHEILCFLTDELVKIRKRSGLRSSWPSEDALQTLVDLCAGLWVYAATVVRFVGDPNSNGAEDQLCAVLSLAARVAERNNADHPLSELDLFYTLIMQRIPPKVLLTIQKILLIRHLAGTLSPRTEATPTAVANVLCLTEPQFHNACEALRSVMEFKSGDLVFHHASFMDFIQDPERSAEFSILSGCQDIVWKELLERLNTTGSFHRYTDDYVWPKSNSSLLDTPKAYILAVRILFLLFSYIRPLEPSTATPLLDLRLQIVTQFSVGQRLHFSPQEWQEKVPRKIYKKIVRQSYNPLVYLQEPEYSESRVPYIFGLRGNKVVFWKAPRHWGVELYPFLW